jgi:hypothetical protein
MQLAGGFGLMRGQALTGKIENSFVRRLEAMLRKRSSCFCSQRSNPRVIRCCSGGRLSDSGSALRPRKPRRRPGCWKSVSG